MQLFIRFTAIRITAYATCLLFAQVARAQSENAAAPRALLANVANAAIDPMPYLQRFSMG